MLYNYSQIVSTVSAKKAPDTPTYYAADEVVSHYTQYPHICQGHLSAVP